MKIYITVLLAVTLSFSSYAFQGNVMPLKPIEEVSKSLTDANFSGLFLRGDHSLSSSIWKNGENRIYLESIVQSDDYSDLARILASEVLYEKLTDYPPAAWKETLACLYVEALALTGVQTSSKTGKIRFTGNLWGIMYYTDGEGAADYGILGAHLVNTGKASVPYLINLLDNAEIIFYEGSEEATLGNSLQYRVKDAAAFYIGKITGTPLKHYKNNADRDAQIERLKISMKSDLAPKRAP